MSVSHINCPSCQAVLPLSAAPLPGQWINCPHCRERFRLPTTDSGREGITAAPPPKTTPRAAASMPAREPDGMANGRREPAGTNHSGAFFWVILASAMGCGVFVFGGVLGGLGWWIFSTRSVPVISAPPRERAPVRPVPPPGEIPPRQAAQPVTAIEWFAEGNRRRQRGDTQGAIKAYTRAIELNPRMAAAYCNRGLARSDKGDFDGGIADSTKSIELNPNDPFPYINRANARILKGVDPEASIADATQALKLRPGIPAALLNLGMARVQKGDYDDAIAAFDEALARLPTFAMAYGQRGQAWMNKKNWDKAEADFTRALDLHFVRLDIYRKRGICRMRQGNQAGAIEDFTAVLVRNPRNPRNTPLLVLRGQAHFEAGDRDDAQADLDQALAINPSYAPAHRLRVQIFQRQNDRDAALAACERFVTVQPKLPDALISRAGIHAWRGEEDKALADYRAALALDPKRVWVHLQRGWLHLSAGRDDEAARDAEAGLKIAGWRHRQAPYLAILAHCGQRRQHPDEARRLAAEALREGGAKGWPRPILRYLHGEISDKQLLRGAADNDQRTEAYAYIGIVLWLSGATDKAREHLQWVHDRGNHDFIEYDFALLLLRRLEDAPAREP